MSAYHQIPLRNARDQMIALLFQESKTVPAGEVDTFAPKQSFIPLIIRDLPFAKRTKVPNGAQSTFYLLGGQPNTDYILCDEEGVPVKEDIKGELIELSADDEEFLFNLRSLQVSPIDALAGGVVPNDDGGLAKFIQSWRRVVAITSPPITEDQTFQILARRLNSAGEFTGIQAFLHQTVSLRVGIDTSLEIRFIEQASTDIVFDESTGIYINYNQTVLDGQALVIKILKSQEGIHYQILEEGPNGQRIERSAVVLGGDQGSAGNMDIDLETTGEFKEDTTLVLRAFRNQNDRDNTDLLQAGDLDQKLQVKVRPNTQLVIKRQEDVVAYDAETTIIVEKTQASATYQLFSRQLSLAEYAPDGTIEIQDIDSITGLSSIGDPQVGIEETALNFATGIQQEDSIFVVQATKHDPANGSTVWLATMLGLLVKPNPEVAISYENATVLQDEEGGIILTDTQQGVKYQLRAGTEKIGEPGFHQSDRAIGETSNRSSFGMRIGIDFKIGTATDTSDSLFDTDSLALPTSPLEKATTFNVLAIKSYTKQEAKLNKTVRIKIETPA